MDTLSYKTKSARKEDVVRKWYVVDATDQTVGRLSSKVATILRGKHKPSYTPHVDTGDNVIIINAEKAKFTGNKMAQKTYLSYSLYPGGQKSITAQELLEKKPYAILEKAVKGMLPKNKLGRAMYKKLHVVVGPDHKFGAQKPEVLK